MSAVEMNYTDVLRERHRFVDLMKPREGSIIQLENIHLAKNNMFGYKKLDDSENVFVLVFVYDVGTIIKAKEIDGWTMKSGWTHKILVYNHTGHYNLALSMEDIKFV